MNVPEFLKRAAEKSGFIRESYDDSRVPTHHTNITVVPFFGDIRSSFILSSLLLNRYKEEVKGSKYFIVASWPGFRHLFPYVDEYWSIANNAVIDEFYKDANGFLNNGKYATLYNQNLNLFSLELIYPSEFVKYYDNGLTTEFWNKFKTVKRTFPSIPSVSILGSSFVAELRKRLGRKIFIYPMKWYSKYNYGRLETRKMNRMVWSRLIKRLLSENFVPVICRNEFTFDLSEEFENQCMYISDRDMGNLMGVMRACDCVLDVFSGISRLALMARSPFLTIEDHNKYLGVKEYELDGLCGNDLPRQYIFSFPTIIDNTDSLDLNILDGIVARLDKFLPTLDAVTLPSTVGSVEEVSYDVVKKIKAKKLGTKFIKLPKEEILNGRNKK